MESSSDAIPSDILYFVGDESEVDRLDAKFCSLGDALHTAKRDAKSEKEVRVVYKCIPIARYGP